MNVQGASDGLRHVLLTTGDLIDGLAQHLGVRCSRAEPGDAVVGQTYSGRLRGRAG